MIAQYDSCRNAIGSVNGNAVEDIRWAYLELEIGKQLKDDEKIIQGYIDLGRAFSSLKKYDMALSNTHKALLALQDAGTEEQRADAGRLAGSIYLRLKNNDLAKTYLDESYRYYSSKADTVNLIKTMGEIAILYGQSGDYDKCIMSLNEIDWLTYRYKRNKLRLVTLLNLSLAYQYAGQPDQGLHILERIRLECPDSIVYLPEYHMAYLLNRGELRLAKGSVDSAENDFMAGLAIADEISDWETKIQFLKNLASISLRKKDYAQLSTFYQQLSSAQDSLESDIDKGRIAEKELMHDIAKRDQYLEKLEARMLRNRVLTVGFVIIFLLLIGFWYYRYRMKIRNHAKQAEMWFRERKKDNETMTDIAIYFHELRTVVMQVVDSLRNMATHAASETDKKVLKANYNQLIEIVSENKTLLNNFSDARYGEFLQKLSRDYPELSDSEKRICAMLLVGFTSKDIASVLNCTDRSLNNNRSKIRKKLGIPPEKTILEFLKTL
ncbi:MAG: LuxR C-terminal-related transcriptional regulator [Bacteroides sp.]|nr:LuxR C-terminal-related transcriptional regulator [Ruminococcus flavefaciens]MCM1555635.1 LuxR C-terminal-related transcriptional regulator [Bacteroides sp.]